MLIYSIITKEGVIIIRAYVKINIKIHKYLLESLIKKNASYCKILSQSQKLDNYINITMKELN